ncbi:hypothetical protein [Rugosimonospora africana]|uniref:Uncharacterized protein n=1 Tax=Rugosimonospora africana TaxID=556532 RepID=A0A8J3R3D9_9ACTN|nr:hypothetical protein [Rugosimonospora africana]GIH20660.1 hypothetical protein Raf01_88320 [Rugosimonospora africana]
MTAIFLAVILTGSLVADAMTGGRLGREYTEAITRASDEAYGSLGAVGWVVANVGVIAVFLLQFLLLTNPGRRLRAGLAGGFGDAVIRAAGLPLPDGARRRYVEEWRDTLADLRERGAPRHRRAAELVDIVVHVPVLMVVLRRRSRATADER